jgi:crotonobetainyl-CoA:carnitine CoA-transferase CaiB-like acyl-CoA transferase
MAGPLAGIRVVDLTSIMMGPYVTRLLGDMGADVIKVESPDGDVLRRAGPARHPGMGPYFLNLNRNKRSVVLDLRKQQGADVLRRLLARSDVLVHGLRPQSMARLGLGYEEVRTIRRSIVYCGVYGYGEAGPYAGRPAYDDLIQGLSGAASLEMAVSGTPAYHPTPMADRTTALMAAYAITAALLAAGRTGEGQSIEVPMFEVMADSVLTTHLAAATFDPPLAPVGYPRMLTPARGPYRTGDGHICVMFYTDQHWDAFFDLIGRPELRTEQRYHGSARAEAQGELNAIAAAAMPLRTSGEWLAAFESAGIPANRMHTLDTLLEDEHLHATGFFSMSQHPTEGALRMTGNPVTYTHTVHETVRHAPTPGEHTESVLEECGYSAEERAGLREAGITTCRV